MKETRVMILLYCSLCVKDKLPAFIEKHKDKLHGNAKIEDIMSHWDEATDKSVSDVADLCGCVLPNNSAIKAAPNSRRFIKCPCDHASKYHFSPLPKAVAPKQPSTAPRSSTFTKNGYFRCLHHKIC